MAAPSGMPPKVVTGPAAVTSGLPSKVAAPPRTCSSSLIWAHGPDLSTCAPSSRHVQPAAQPRYITVTDSLSRPQRRYAAVHAVQGPPLVVPRWERCPQ
jgi:hypothetical protein